MNQTRPLSAREEAVLGFLLAAEFEGVEALRQQAASCQVSELDPDGGLSLRPIQGSPADVTRRVVTEGDYVDSDGGMVHVLVHVVDGWLDELEIYREDGQRVKTPPTAENLTISYS